jgi:hypothetical protein
LFEVVSRTPAIILHNDIIGEHTRPTQRAAKPATIHRFLHRTCRGRSKLRGFLPSAGLWPLDTKLIFQALASLVTVFPRSLNESNTSSEFVLFSVDFSVSF